MYYLYESGLYLTDDTFHLCHTESLDLFLLFVKYTFLTYNGSLANAESFKMRSGGQRKKEKNKYFPYNEEKKRGARMRPSLMVMYEKYSYRVHQFPQTIPSSTW